MDSCTFWMPLPVTTTLLPPQAAEIGVEGRPNEVRPVLIQGVQEGGVVLGAADDGLQHVLDRVLGVRVVDLSSQQRPQHEPAHRIQLVGGCGDKGLGLASGHSVASLGLWVPIGRVLCSFNAAEWHLGIHLKAHLRRHLPGATTDARFLGRRLLGRGRGPGGPARPPRPGAL